MSQTKTEPEAPRSWGAWIVVAALVLGLLAGVATARLAPDARDAIVSGVAIVGGLWLDALKMTVIPLMMALLVKGVVGSAAVTGEGRITRLALSWFLALYILSAVAGAILMPALLASFPLSQSASEAVRAGFAAVNPGSVQSSVAGIGDFIRSFIPSNLFAAAANGSILQLVVFALLFSLALTFLDQEKRRPVVTFFSSVADALLVLIGWILRLAALGVFTGQIGRQ